jgi:hypothetical protein
MDVRESLSAESGYDIVEPRASAMIEAFRAVGYSLPTAIADLIDNSITAKAKNIWLMFSWNGSNSYIAIRAEMMKGVNFSLHS